MSRVSIMRGHLHPEQGWSQLLGSSLMDLAYAFILEAELWEPRDRQLAIRRAAQHLRLVAQMVDQGSYDDEYAIAWLDSGLLMLRRHREERRHAARPR